MKEVNRLFNVIFLLITGLGTNYRQITHNIREKIKPMHCIGFINRLIRIPKAFGRKMKILYLLRLS